MWNRIYFMKRGDVKVKQTFMLSILYTCEGWAHAGLVGRLHWFVATSWARLLSIAGYLYFSSVQAELNSGLISGSLKAPGAWFFCINRGAWHSLRDGDFGHEHSAKIIVIFVWSWNKVVTLEVHAWVIGVVDSHCLWWYSLTLLFNH